MIRRLAASLALAASLLAPTAVLAASPAGAYEISGIENDRGRLEAAGKMQIDGSGLVATVGCNTFTAAVTEFGDGFVSFGEVASTKMGCLDPAQAAAEEALAAILAAGTLRLGDGQLDSPAGRLLVTFFPSGDDPVVVMPEPLPVEISPDPNATPDPLAGFSLDQCVGVLSPEELEPYGIGVVNPDGSGSSGSGGAVSEPGVIVPDATSGTVSGGGTDGYSGTTSGSEAVAPPTVIDPAPVPMPAETPGTDVKPLPVEAGPMPMPIVEPGLVPTAEQCRELLSRIRTLGAPMPAAADGEAALTGAGAEDAAANDQPSLVGIVVATFVAGLTILGLAYGRATRSRPSGD